MLKLCDKPNDRNLMTITANSKNSIIRNVQETNENKEYRESEENKELRLIEA